MTTSHLYHHLSILVRSLQTVVRYVRSGGDVTEATFVCFLERLCDSYVPFLLRDNTRRWHVYLVILQGLTPGGVHLPSSLAGEWAGFMVVK